MQNSKAEKLRKLASKRQIVRAKDARELGIPRTYLPRLARRGDLEKVGRGLYSSRDFSGTENTSLIEAAYQIRYQRSDPFCGGFGIFLPTRAP